MWEAALQLLSQLRLYSLPWHFVAVSVQSRGSSYIDVVLTTSKTGSMRVAKSFFSNPEQILSNIIIISSRPCGQIQKLQYLAQQLRKKSGLNVSTQITQRRQESSLLSPSLSNEGTNCSRAPQML